MELPILLLIGLMTLISFYFGKTMKYIKLPTIIGFMIIGVILGPSFFNILNDNLQENLSFLTEIALGFVALSIGLELEFSSLKKLGSSIIWIIFLESFAAFAIVTGSVYLFTENLPLSLIFGAIAPASAPAGTVAVINEYKARGPLTKALYAVVGFDDGLGIIIFGFASAFAKSILALNMGETTNILAIIAKPLEEVGLSLIVGLLLAIIFCFLSKKLKNQRDLFILIFGFTMTGIGLSIMLDLSLILTNMIIGMTIVNTQNHSIVSKIGDELKQIMPLLFILFFTLAGSNLHISALPSLGILGLIYALSRTVGLISGSKLGAIIGKADTNIRKYLGLGILSQAGVAIGLSLIIKKDFAIYGQAGNEIGLTIITTVTATCLFFEIIGPILTKIALTKAGEIK